MSEERVTQRLAKYVTGLRYEDVPPAAVALVERAIADNVGTCLLGLTAPAARIAADLAQHLGGRPSATLLGTGERLPPPSAAQVNSIRAHVNDFDDTSLPVYAHLSSVLVPSLLALGEEVDASGQDVITAYAAGFEVGARLGAAMNPSHHMSGFHCTGTLGTVVGAAAAARLLRLPTPQVAHAIGIAVSSASGLICQWGSMSKAIQVGNAARNATLAAMLAQRGFDSNEDTLGHSRGLCIVMAGEHAPDLDALVAGLGSSCALLEPKSLLVKSYPIGTAMQAPLQALESIRREVALRPDTVAAITVGASELQVKNRPPERFGRPRTGLEARFNWEYLLASAIVRGPFQHAHLDDDSVGDAPVLAFMPRVQVVVDDELRDNAEYGVRLTVRMSDGHEFERLMPSYRGWPSDPLSEDEFEAKFMANSARLFPAEQGARFYRAARHFSDVGSVRQAVARLVAASKETR